MKLRLISVFMLAAFLAPQAPAAEKSAADNQIVSPVLQEMKSPARAALMSAVLPGSGEIYSGAKRGYLFMVAEAAFIVGHIIADRKAEQLRDDYIAEVRANVGFDGVPESQWPEMFDRWNMEDFEHATMFDNWRNIYTDESPESDDGDPIERVGKFYWLDRESVKNTKLSEKENTSEMRNIALEYREDSNSWFKKSKMMIGGIVLNHFVSFIDARIAAKIHNRKISINSSVSMEDGSGRFSVALAVSL